MPINIGSTSIAKAYVGATEAQKIYVGTTEVWSNWTDAGMDKSGSFNPNSTSITKATGWTARAGSTVTSDALVIGSAATADISVSVNFAGTSAQHRAYIYKNGSQIAVSATSGFTATVVTVSLSSYAVQAGDYFEVFVWSSTASRSDIAASNTFITVSKVS